MKGVGGVMNECLIGVGSRQAVNIVSTDNSRNFVLKGTEKWDTGLRKFRAAKQQPVERETAKETTPLREASWVQNWP